MKTKKLKVICKCKEKSEFEKAMDNAEDIYTEIKDSTL